MIVTPLARLIIREHLYKPIQGSVLTLGRQTVGMTYEEVLELAREEGYIVPDHTQRAIAPTRDQKTRHGKGTSFISDDVFFRLLGSKEMLAMDVSNYEAADILHDVNQPVPESLHGKFDFIIDGGTFDHMFDVRTAFVNVVKMLATGGRVFHWDAASNYTGGAYLSFGPDLFYDYYALNQFSDCKVYVVEVDRSLSEPLWDFYEFEGHSWYTRFMSKRTQIVVVLAEKGPFSTWDKIPVQGRYRDAQLWDLYRAGYQLIQKSDRKALVGRERLALPGRDKQRRSRGVRKVLRQVLGRIPDKWKRRLPVELKARVSGMLEEKVRGYRYVGRI